MPMFQQPPAQVPRIPMNLGLLPDPANPTTNPITAMARAFGMGGQRRNGRGQDDERPAYTPAEVLKSQQELGQYFQNRPAAAYNWPGYIGTAGNAFLGTYLPTRAEQRAQANENISSEAARRAASASTLDAAIAALTGGSPEQRNAAVGAHLNNLDPLRRAQIRVIERDQQQQDEIFGAGGNGNAPAGPFPSTVGVRPDAGVNQGVVVPPPGGQAAPPPPQQEQILPPGAFTPLPDGRMNLGGPPPPPEAESPVQPAQARPQDMPPLMQQSIGQGGAQPSLPQPPAAAPAQTPNTLQGVRQMYLRLSPVDRATVAAEWKKDPGKAMQMLRQLADPRAAQQTVVEHEAAQAEGKALGTARAGLPSALRSGQSFMRSIDAVLNDPYLHNITGWEQTGPLAYLPYSPRGNRTLSRVNQIQGQAFLQMFEGLRGGGQISDAEGRKAAAAISRLENLGIDDAGYVDALKEVRKEIHDLMNLARQKAGLAPEPYMPPVLGQNGNQRRQPSNTLNAPRAPNVGAMEDGYRFKGGNPADQSNWERVR